MKFIKKIVKALLIIIMAVIVLTAIALNYETVLASHKNKNVIDAAVNVSDFTIPENVSVVGLGEATHGNIEFQELKLDIFKILVEKYDYRAFALEADFGDCLEANEYIQGADGNARDIVNNMVFELYHTQQMADILDWMKEYNSTVSEDKRLRFYGFDMQNPEKCVMQLHKFLAKYNLTAINTSGLDYLVDLTRTQALTDGDINEIKAELSELKKVIEPMKSDSKDVNIIYGLKLVENTLTCFNYLFLDTTEKYNARDICMADNVEWILYLEKEIGSGKVMLGAHDSHISKKGNDATRISMGGELKNRLGDSYYSLGSDFFKGTDNSKVSSMVSKGYQRKNSFGCR